MKKILTSTALIALSLASVPAAFAADNFSGAYAGITAGFTNMKGKGNFSADSYDGKSNFNEVYSSISSLTGTFGQTGFSGGLRLGYGALLDALYVGGELSAVFNSNSDGTPWTLSGQGAALSTTTAAPTGTATAAIAGVSYAAGTKGLSLKQKEAFGLALRLGYLATQKAMIYLSLGMNYARYALTSQITSVQTATVDISAATVTALNALTSLAGPTTSTARALTFVPGMGVEVMLSNNVSFRTDVAYDLGKSLFSSFDTDHLPGGIKLNRTSFNVGLSWHF